MDLINYTDRKTFYEYRNTIKIVYSEYKDAEYLKDHLRPTDIRECQIHGITPYRALNIPFKEEGHITFTGLIDNKPACMFGTVPINETTGSVWLLGSEALEKNWIAFLKCSSVMVDEIQSYYPIIENVVPADHVRTIKWLTWLGFIFHTDPVIINSFSCVRFVRCQDDLEVQMLST